MLELVSLVMVVSVLICVGAFVWWLAERLFNRSNR